MADTVRNIRLGHVVCCFSNVHFNHVSSCTGGLYHPSRIPCSLTVSVLFVLNSGGNRLFCGVCLPGRTGSSSCSQGQQVKCELHNFRQTCTYKANEPKHRNHSPSLGLVFGTTCMFKTTHPCLRTNGCTPSFPLSMWILCLQCGFEVFASS